MAGANVSKRRKKKKEPSDFGAIIVLIIIVWIFAGDYIKTHAVSMIRIALLIGVIYAAYVVYKAVHVTYTETGLRKLGPVTNLNLGADIDNMDGHTFEYWCANLLQRNGFDNVCVTQGSNDQGVDITARKDGFRYAIQCKRYSKPLGNHPVQEVAAGRAIYSCDRAAVMTNSYFTEGAVRAAMANNVELWDRNYIKKMLSSSE